MAQVVSYDPTLHDQRSASYTHCAQGGTECGTKPEFTVNGPKQKISACHRHLAGAVREADGMPTRVG
jgi:hypothetical protein